jgi:hypothetical protein
VPIVVKIPGRELALAARGHDGSVVQRGKEKVNGENVNPLIQDGQKFVPSLTRVFSKGHPMHVYFQPYEQGAPAVQPLIAFVSFYRGQNKVFETQPVKTADVWNNHVKTCLSNSASANNLPPGKYDCQVSVLAPTGQKATFWLRRLWLCPSV